MSAEAASALPDLNDLVAVAAADGVPHGSRIEDVRGEEIALAAPRLPASQEPPVPGEPLTIRWNTPRCLMVLPVEFVSAPRATPPLWWVRVTGTATRQQRRSYVRAGVGLVARVEFGPGGSGGTHSGIVVDLSEGGARVVLEDADAGDLPPGTPLVLRFGLDDTLVRLPGWSRRSPEPSAGEDRIELPVEFAQPVPVADLLRRHVFARQILERRSMR